MRTLFSRLKVGDRFDARWSETLNKKRYEGGPILKEWKITKIYPYHVLAVSDDGMRESFTYGEFVEMGLEPQKPHDKILNYDNHFSA